jgi:hypothetical protein
MRTLLGLTLVALVVGGGAAAGRPAATPTPAAAAVTAHSATRWTVDRLLAETMRRYGQEVHGGKVFGQLHRVARDPALRSLVRSGNVAALRSYLNRMYPDVWYHWHVSRVRVLSGSHLLAEAGVPFVLPPEALSLAGPNGTRRTLQVSIQDEIGIVRYMSRNYPAQVVIRGRGPGHDLTSLAGALDVHLPNRGTAVVGGRRYEVRSFADVALDREPVRVWLLHLA